MPFKFIYSKAMILTSIYVVLHSASYAQIELTGEHGYNVRAGAYFPTSRSARRMGGDVWFTAGAEYGFYKFPVNGPNGLNAAITGSIDYYGSNSLFAVPILVNVRARYNRWFYSAGVGVAIYDDIDSNQGSAFAYQFSAGTEISQAINPIYLMAKYSGTGASGLEGLSVVVGIRF